PMALWRSTEALLRGAYHRSFLLHRLRLRLCHSRNLERTARRRRIDASRRANLMVANTQRSVASTFATSKAKSSTLVFSLNQRIVHPTRDVHRAYTQLGWPHNVAAKKDVVGEERVVAGKNAMACAARYARRQ